MFHMKLLECDLSILPYFDTEKLHVGEHVAAGIARFCKITLFCRF